MNVTVKYNLSQIGQKAALIAGRSATTKVTESMTFEDPALIDKLIISSDGSLTLDAEGRVNYKDNTLYLDAPPSDLNSLLAILEAHKETNRLDREEEVRAEREKAAQLVEERLAKVERDAPVVEDILREVEGLLLDAPLSLGVGKGSYDVYFREPVSGVGNLESTPEQKARLSAIFEARSKYAQEKKAEEERILKAAREKMIAEHGGTVFPVEGGLCSFSGAGLWSGGQTKRWVGIFTAAKGIDTFLDSPRGEHTFVITSLGRGDCIQGAGFDTNSRGKRRSETEWFGVIVKSSPTEIVVSLQNSRSATIKAAAKLGDQV